MLQAKSRPATIRQLIIFVTLVRIALACCLNLGNDEVYYFTYAVQPDWNHFDHPPLIGLFIRATTLNLQWINDLSTRLPAIIGAAINTWLIARCGLLVRSGRTGLLAAILYQVSIYTSIISGVFILPDSVQLVFWLAALYGMLTIVTRSENPEKNKNVVWLGLWIGLATMSKVHGVFLWFGFLAYVVSYERRFLKNPWLYVSLFLTALIVSPILYWNFANDFITWRFHSERVTADQGINFKSFAVTSVGQIAYANPVLFVIYVMMIGAVVRKQHFLEKRYRILLLWCGLPIILITTLVSLLRDTFPHWSGPGFIAVMLLTAAFMDQRLASADRRTFRLLQGAAWLMLTICFAGPLLIRFYPGTLSEKKSPETGYGDFTLDLYGWEELLPAFEKIRNEDIRQNSMTAASPLVTHKWFPGGHLYYYVAYPLKMPFAGIGSLHDLHKFQWINQLYQPLQTGMNAYYITPSNNFKDPAEIYAGTFRHIEKAATIEQKRNGKAARYWYVYRLKGMNLK